MGSGGANGGSGGIGGAGAAGASGAGGLAPEDSRTWNWEPCGTIPSTEVSPYMRYEVGSAVEGGHPRTIDMVRWGITGLAMSADGLTLVSMGGATLVWDVAFDFSASTAIYVHDGAPERPRIEISPDGLWIAISGDGRLVIPRSGLEVVGFGGAEIVNEACFPAELRFSPDGEWLAGAGWTGAIDVFRVADVEPLASSGGGVLEPTTSMPATCVAGNGVVPSGLTTTRSAFTPDGRTLVTEAGSRYATSDWRLEGAVMNPAPHGLRGGFEVSAIGGTLVSDCRYGVDTDSEVCAPYAAPFPKFSAEGHWIVAGATLTHVSGETRVLDAAALVGIFAPNGDVIAAGADNSLTRYCKVE